MYTVIINVETSSLDPRFGSIVEIGAMKIQSKTNFVPLLNYIVKPRKQVYADSWIFKNNRYLTPQIVEHGMPWEVIHDQVQLICDENIVVGWNQSFDFRWLESYGIEIKHKGKDLKTDRRALQDMIVYTEHPTAIMECFYAAIARFL